MIIASSLAIAGIIAGAAAVVTALYVAARLYLIPPNHEAVVVNSFESDPEKQVTVLKSGPNLVPKPWCTVHPATSLKDQFIHIKGVNVKSLDGIDLECDAWARIRIENPIKSYLAVEDYRTGVMQEASASLGVLLRNSVFVEELDLPSQAQNEEVEFKAAKPGKKSWDELSASVIAQVQTKLTEWGIRLFEFRIIKLESKQQAINREIAEQKIRALRVRVNAFEIVCTAQAEKEATLIRAMGANDAARRLTDPNALEVYLAEKSTEAATALGRGAGVLSVRASTNPSAFLSQGRQPPATVPNQPPQQNLLARAVVASV